MNEDVWATKNVYYYMTGNILNVTQIYNMVERKSPNNYVVRFPPFIMAHVRNNIIIEKEPIIVESREEITKLSSIIARRMLTGVYRKKKIIKTKLKRKPVKKCICKK